jgi:nitrogen fixation/metabolism regulation signal transduction histidine kinase
MAALTAIVTTAAAAIGAVTSIGGYISGQQSASDAADAAKASRAARKKQARWIRNTQMSREEDLKEQNIAMLKDERVFTKEAAATSMESGMKQAELSEKATETKLQTGLGAQIKESIFALRKGTEGVQKAAAESGFAGSGATTEALARAEKDVGYAQATAGEASMASYTLGMEGAEVQRDTLKSQYDIAIKGADVSFERGRFGAIKDWKRTTSELESRARALEA